MRNRQRGVHARIGRHGAVAHEKVFVAESMTIPVDHTGRPIRTYHCSAEDVRGRGTFASFRAVGGQVATPPFLHKGVTIPRFSDRAERVSGTMKK